jgi:hypothetical protein
MDVRIKCVTRSHKPDLTEYVPQFRKFGLWWDIFDAKESAGRNIMYEFSGWPKTHQYWSEQWAQASLKRFLESQQILYVAKTSTTNIEYKPYNPGD